jgi:hypothetical protein
LNPAICGGRYVVNHRQEIERHEYLLLKHAQRLSQLRSDLRRAEQALLEVSEKIKQLEERTQAERKPDRRLKSAR